jgi:glutathione synthase/RimK-type ligase-like ATP-grasp enzyme
VIVVLCSSEERIVAHLYRALQERNIPSVLIEQSNIPNTVKFNLETNGKNFGGYFRFGDYKQIDFSEITSIYARPGVGYFEVYETYSQQEIDFINEECMVSLSILLEHAPFLVVNRPSTSRSNASKPHQANLIRSYGFSIPKTLVTNDPQEFKNFYEAMNRNVIYKSISSIRSIVKKVKEEDLNRLDTLQNCPVQLQECIEGVDVRVHVVGENCFPALIHSSQSDYRYDREIQMEVFDLPPEIAEKCIKLAFGLGLPLAGIDVRATSEGEYYCFEVNPSPVFTYYEERTGLPITDALCGLLQSGIDPTRQ